MQNEVIVAIQRYLHHGNQELCASACFAFARLSEITIHPKYLSTFLTLIKWAKDKTQPELIRFRSLLVLNKATHLLHQDIIDDLLDTVKKSCLDPTETQDIRLISIGMLGSIYHQCQENVIIDIISFLMQIIKDTSQLNEIRLKSVQALKEFGHWVYAKENKHILIDLLNIAHATSSGYTVMMEIYALLSKAKHSLFNDEQVHFSVHDYLMGLTVEQDLHKRMSIEVLSYLSYLIDGELSVKVINALIAMLKNENAEIKAITCNALKIYSHHMNLQQKINLLCILSLQPLTDYLSQELLTFIYKEYRNQLTTHALLNLPINHDQHLLPENIQKIMRYSF